MELHLTTPTNHGGGDFCVEPQIVFLALWAWPGSLTASRGELAVCWEVGRGWEG